MTVILITFVVVPALLSGFVRRRGRSRTRSVIWGLIVGAFTFVASQPFRPMVIMRYEDGSRVPAWHMFASHMLVATILICIAIAVTKPKLSNQPLQRTATSRRL